MVSGNEYLVFATSWVAGEDGAIVALNLNTDTGELSEVGRTTGIENPFYLALSPDRRVLYAAFVPGDFENDSGSIGAFEIVDNSGRLRKLNEKEANGRTTCYVDVDPTGQSVVFANYTSGSIGAFSVQEDGSLGEMKSFIEHQGASMVDAERQEAAHAHCSVVSPGGRHVYVSDLGLDQILGYELDVGSATLTPLDQSYVRTVGGGGPRHFTYHPHGGYVYANNELGNSVNVYSYDADRGLLVERQVISSLPDDFEGASSTADVIVSPDGHHLYCSNRGHDSIAIYRIDDGGCLTLVDHQASLGEIAQNLAITPDGKILLCANMLADAGLGPQRESHQGENVGVFRIDPDSGTLTPLTAPMALARPSCLVIV